MLRQMLAAAITALVTVSAAPAADEAVTIKVKKAAAGETTKESKTDENTVTISANVNGQAINQDVKGDAKFVFTEEVIDRPDPAKRATKLKRTYEKAEARERGEEVEYGLAGKTVLIEKGKDRYTFTADGKPLTGKAADKLEKEFNQRKSELQVEDVLLPKKAVKVGDSWAIDAKQVVEVFADEMMLDEKKVKGTGKLLKVYDKGGHKYGTMEFVIDMPLLKMIGKDGEKEMGAGSFMKMEVTVDACIDGGTSDGGLKGKMTGLMKFTEMGIEITAKLAGTMESSGTPVKK